MLISVKLTLLIFPLRQLCITTNHEINFHKIESIYLTHLPLYIIHKKAKGHKICHLESQIYFFLAIYFQTCETMPFFLIFHQIKSRFGDCQFNSGEDLECYHDYDYQYCCKDVVAWSNKIWCRYFITDWFHFMLIQFFI